MSAAEVRPCLYRRQVEDHVRPSGVMLLSGLLCMALAGLVVSLGAWSEALPLPADTAARIDGILSAEYPTGEPGAAVLISRDGKVILKKGYGLADIERKAPAMPDTVFRIASVTKIFTATAILTLAEQGKLDLKDPVAKYFPGRPADRGIAVWHLLTHTSGLADYLDRPDFMDWVRHEYTVEQLIDSFKERAASFSPGAKNVYCNSNYILLGAIVEKLSGRGFGEFVKANIFDPLGMRSTSCAGSLKDVPRLATAYEPARTADDKPDWSRFLIARPYTMRALYAAGGCLSSVEDLSRFNEALLRGKLLRKESLAYSFKPVALNDGTLVNTGQGGWQLDKINGRRAAMRGGSMPGACTWLITMPDDDVAVILLSNRTPGKPRCGMLAVKLAQIATGD